MLFFFNYLKCILFSTTPQIRFSEYIKPNFTSVLMIPNHPYKYLELCTFMIAESLTDSRVLCFN